MVQLTHSVHVSERKSFRGCKLRWNWIFREMYYPSVTAKPLEFGVAFHKALEVFYNPYTWALTKSSETRKTLILGAIAKFATECEKQRQAFIKGPDGWTYDDEKKQDYDERVQLGKSMLLRHLGTVAPEADKNITPIKVEIGFEVPLIDPDWDEQLRCECNVCWDRWMASEEGKAEYEDCHEKHFCDDPDMHRQYCWEGLPVTIGGRVDCLAEDDLGRYWIYDWKTAARLSNDNEFLELEDQITTYCWALQEALGIKIAGFIYAEIKKVAFTPPEPLKVVRLGRRFTVSKSDVSWDAELYEETVKENDPEAYYAGLYEDYLTWLREEGNVTHMRHQVHRTKRQLTNFHRDLVAEVRDMIGPDLRVYPSPGRFACQSCAFMQPCLGRQRGEDYQGMLGQNFEKRSYHYWESAPSTTEKAGRTYGS